MSETVVVGTHHLRTAPARSAVTGGWTVVDPWRSSQILGFSLKKDACNVQNRRDRQTIAVKFSQDDQDDG